MNDVNRLRILQDVIDRRLTTRLAATRLDISDRHCRRLLERYREHGPLSLVNRPWSVTVSLWHSTATRPVSSGSTTSRPSAEMARLSLVVP